MLSWFKKWANIQPSLQTEEIVCEVDQTLRPDRLLTISELAWEFSHLGRINVDNIVMENLV